MKLAAKPIMYGKNNRISMPVRGYGHQNTVFAKEIIDKYAKILNYHFDFTALVFLEQMAGAEKRQQFSKNVINITWKLLSFLMKEGEKRNFVVYQNPWIMENVTKELENNLMQIRNENIEIYQKLKRCYEIYQKTIKNEKVKEKINQKEIENTIQYVEEQVQQTTFFSKEKDKKKTTIILGTLNKVFFHNLNHVIQDNKILSYREVWKKSVEKQLEQHYLEICMIAFVKEQQTARKQELFWNILHNYDGKMIHEYLGKAKESVFTQFIAYLQMITGTDYIIKRVGGKVFQEQKNRNNHTRNIINGYERERMIEQKTEEYEKEEEKRRLEEGIKDYKHIYDNIMEILGQTQEITRNIVIEKTNEYKELFYEYIQSEKMEKENIEMEQDSKNPEVFSKSEIELLLKEEEVIDKKEEYAEEEHQRVIYLKEKLNLLSMKEVIERCLLEDTGILQREKIENIAQILKSIDFQSRIEEENLYEQKIRFVKQGELDNILEKDIQIADIVQIFHNGEDYEKKILFSVLRSILLKEEAKGKETEISKEKLDLIEMLQVSKSIERKDGKTETNNHEKFIQEHGNIEKLIYAINHISTKEKSEIESQMIKYMKKLHHNGKEWDEKEVHTKNKATVGIEDVNVIFQDGILSDRKLLYLAMEEGINEILTEEKSEHKKSRQELLSLKSKMIQEEDYKKRMSGDWRFLMKKKRSIEIIKAIEELSTQGKIWLQEKVEKKIQAFYKVQEKIYHLYKQSQESEKSLENIYQKYEDVWKEWALFFTKSEMIQMQEEKVKQDNLYNQRIQYTKEGRLDNLFERNIQIADIVQILRSGKNAEKKFLFFALRNILLQGEETKRKETEISREKLNLMSILQVSGVIEGEKEKIGIEKCERFIQNHEHIEKIIYAINHISSKEKDEIESQLAIYIKELYRTILKQEEELRAEGLIEQKGDWNEKNIEDERGIWTKWFSFFKQEEKEELFDRKAMLHIDQQEENIEKLEEILSVGTLSERKLLFLSMQMTIDEEIIQTGINPNKIQERKMLLSMKKILLSGLNERKINHGDWDFLLDKSQSRKMLQIIHSMDKTVQKKVVSNLRGGFNIISLSPMQEKFKSEIINNSKIMQKKQINKQKIIEETRKIWEHVLTKKDREVLRHRKLSENLKKEHKIELRDFWGNKENDVESIEIKLKKEPYYVNMLYNIIEEKQKYYNFSKYLRRKQTHYWDEEFSKANYLTQRNSDFMEPQVSLPEEPEQGAMSKKLQYQEESVHIILSYTRNKEVDLHRRNQNVSVGEQERTIKELKSSILEYQLELEDKEKRLDTIEEKIKNQEKNIQFLKSTQDKMSRQVDSSAEAKRRLNQLKDELYLEQMRSGRL